MQELSDIIYCFAALFIIFDPLLAVPLFSAMTRGQSVAERHRQASIAVAVAGALMYVFLFFNTLIFNLLGLNLHSFQIAGGSILFFLGLQMTLGIDIGRKKKQSATSAGVVIGTPILCGPGTITTVMLLSKSYGIFVLFISITLSLAATWLILYYSENIQKHLGEVITDIIGKVLGMLIAAIAVKIIASGIVKIIASDILAFAPI